MIKTIRAKHLKIGMYVILQQNWFERLLNPFRERQFLIENDEQLNNVRELGVIEIRIDTSKSKIVKDVENISHPKAGIEPPETWNPDKDLTESLRQTILDESLEPKVKAKAVYQESLSLMKTLFDRPTAEHIAESKKAISEIADMILREDDTAMNLLKITEHDFYTYTHSVNVGVQGLALAKRLYGTNSEHNMHELGAAFFLHDLGKVNIDPAILNKPGRLDDKEMKIMRTHASQSFQILKRSGHLSPECASITMQHHEREDGTGYPRGLKGDEIHDYSRICCIADVFDALTAERSYKKGLPTFKALKIMKEEMLGHFHKDIFENFVFLFK